MTATTIPSRPDLTDEIVKAASLKIANGFSGLDSNAKQKLVDLICATYEDGMNGYELAKEVESSGWDREINPSFVEDLDFMSFACDTLLEEAQREWVVKYGIEPKLKIGTKVRQGTITGVHSRTPAAYMVKPHGQDDEKSGHARHIIHFEILEREMADDTSNEDKGE